MGKIVQLANSGLLCPNGPIPDPDPRPVRNRLVLAAFSWPAHFRVMVAKEISADLMESWPLSYAATLGSAVRKQGIFLELRAHLPPAARKSLKIEGGLVVLRMSAEDGRQFAAATEVVGKVLENSERLPVIPREIEDILQISSTERYRWLNDGRLPSAGTRTVKLRGRAKHVTFHVFDPRVVEELLDQDRVSQWREEDAQTAAEHRRRASWRTNRPPRGAAATETSEILRGSSKLSGWEEFERDGPLRKSSRH